jgi:DNA polymerase I-like protein with 3'-5' exonuclease and polymerase domains
VWLPAIESINEYIRAKEERVAVNFTIQSGNFLTLRAINTLQKRIESMGLTNDVKIINTVHDSIVLVIREDPKLIELINKELISAMCDGYDKDAPVPLEAEMDIGKNLVDTITLPNNCSEEHIEEVLKELQTIE